MPADPEFNVRLTLDELRALLVAVVFTQEGMEGQPVALEKAGDKIAACCRVFELPLLTNNLSDFQQIQGEFSDLEIVNPDL